VTKADRPRADRNRFPILLRRRVSSPSFTSCQKSSESRSHGSVALRVEIRFLRRARVMDAATIVGKYCIANRSVSVLASKASEDYEELKPLFVAFIDTPLSSGTLGTGKVIKLAHNPVRRGIGSPIGDEIFWGAKAGTKSSKGATRRGLVSLTIAFSGTDVGLAIDLSLRHNAPIPYEANLTGLTGH
jgi:hypothetical protein